MQRLRTIPAMGLMTACGAGRLAAQPAPHGVIGELRAPTKLLALDTASRVVELMGWGALLQ